MNRRGFMARAGVAAGALFFGSTVAKARADSGAVVYALDDPFSVEGKDIVAGRISRAVSANAVELATDEGTSVVTFEDDAVFWRDGIVSLSSFQPGEQVIIEGSKTAAGFQGTSMMNELVVVDTRVSSRDGSWLETSQGRLQITAETRREQDGFLSEVPADAVAPGMRLQALARTTGTDDLIALRIY